MSEFQTYYIVDGVRVNSYATMKKMIEGGKTAIEVSATQQQIEAQDRAEKARANAALDEKIRRAAEQRAHEQSPEGMQEAARRTALENPGGIVSGGEDPHAELEEYLPHRTSLI